MRAWTVPILAALLLGSTGLAPGRTSPQTAPGSSPERSSAPTAGEVAILIREGRYALAEADARRLLLEVESARGSESLEVAAILDLLVEALWRGGKARDPEAQQLAERSLRVREGTLGPDHPEVARSVFNLAIVLKERGEYARGLSLYERALDIRERTPGPGPIDLADSLHGLAGLLLRMGEYDRARPLYERALGIRERVLGADHPDVASSLNGLALLLWNLGDYAEARPLYERSLEIKAKSLGPGHPDVGRGMNNLALLLWNTGDHAGARLLYERALPILEKALGPDHPDVASNMNYLALLLRDMKEFARAREYFERAGRILEKRLGDHPRLAENLHNRAVLLRDLGEYAAARPLFERSLAILEKADGPEHPDVAKGLNGLGLLLRGAGDDDAARPMFERALAIREKTLGAGHPAVAETLLNLAGALAGVGDKAGALDAALRAEQIGREHLRQTSRMLAERQALNYASVRTSGLGLALGFAAEGVDAAARQRVWDALIRSRALVLDEMAARGRSIHGAADLEVARLAKALEAARGRLAVLVLRGPGQEPAGGFRALLDRVRAEAEQAELELAARSAAFRLERAKRQVGLVEIRAALPPGSALLAYAHIGPAESARGPTGGQARAGGSYLTLLLPSGPSDPVVVDLGPSQVIDALVRRWKAEVSEEPPVMLPARRRAEAACRAAGEALRRKIWDPVAGYFEGARQLFVVPDGAINLVAMATLPAGETYWIEHGPRVHYLSAERDLVRSTEEPSTGIGLLVVGGPDFDSTGIAPRIPGLPEAGATKPAETRRTSVSSGADRGSQATCADFGWQRFTPLAAARVEADEVAALWRRRGPDAGKGGREVLELTGRQATEDTFKKRVAGRRTVHLATHGFFLDDRCPSVLASAQRTGLEEGEVLPPVTGDSPLLLTGLALAGANGRGLRGNRGDAEDGILTAEEIAAMDLWGVEWVVLSACHTGLGKIQAGEGVLGLRRAVQIAGARSLIMSLWRVDDVVTRLWMRSLYEARLSGLATDEAVRRASLRALADRRRDGQTDHPYYWGAFVAAGDWR